MIIEFSVRNFLSIKEAVTFSMVASNAVKDLEDGKDGSNCVQLESINKKMLKSAVIYGANGSGKSNLLAALRFYRLFILSSSNDKGANDEIETLPFLLSSKTENEPSSFEMIFVIGSTRFRYGFEATKQIVTSEWLFGLDTTTSTKESCFFSREKQVIKVYPRNFKEGKGIEPNTRPNALFLSTVAQLNGEISNKIQNWFKKNINVISGLEDKTTTYTIKRCQEDKTFRRRILQFIKLLGLGIEDISIEETSMKSITETLPSKDKNKRIGALIRELESIIESERKKNNIKTKEVKVNMLHKKYDAANKLIENYALDFSLESRGTQKLIGLLGPWFAVLDSGEALIIDELDSRLHTKLTLELVKMFHSPLNSKNAQLIFASHDTNLLRNDLFRRDQIWFTEKDSTGATDLYSLVEYKINQATSVRNDASFEKDYLIGKYGAIPYFGDIKKFVNTFANEK